MSIEVKRKEAINEHIAFNTIDDLLETINIIKNDIRPNYLGCGWITGQLVKFYECSKCGLYIIGEPHAEYPELGARHKQPKFYCSICNTPIEY